MNAKENVLMVYGIAEEDARGACAIGCDDRGGGAWGTGVYVFWKLEEAWDFLRGSLQHRIIAWAEL